MGLIKAGMGALGGTLADQWKEFFYCDALDKDVLMVKGQKRTSRRSSNNGEDNIITSGSGIAVADGQCMLIVEQGRVVEVCAEPGEFTFDSSTEPSVFTGNFGDSLAQTFQTVAKRFTYGGDTGKDQRVYYINTKELGEILYGTATPIPFAARRQESMLLWDSRKIFGCTPAFFASTSTLALRACPFSRVIKGRRAALRQFTMCFSRSRMQSLGR